MTAGETFLVRVWSAGSPVDDSGTFMIAAFEADTDIMGRTLFIQQYDHLKEEVMTFDISDYAEGTYMLNIATEEGTKTQKFIVQH